LRTDGEKGNRRGAEKEVRHQTKGAEEEEIGGNWIPD